MSSKERDNRFCLKDYIEEGPNTISNIFDILINFGSKPVGVTADIESAFLQIGIDPADREKLSFLWYDNVNSEQPNLVQFRFCCLMFGLKPSPPILGKVVQHHLNSYEEPETVNQSSKLYVDDLASSFEMTMKYFKHTKRQRKLCQKDTLI